MEFVQTHSRETKMSLLHIPPQCSQKDLNDHHDLITGIDNRSQTVELRTGQGLAVRCWKLRMASLTKATRDAQRQDPIIHG